MLVALIRRPPERYVGARLAAAARQRRVHTSQQGEAADPGLRRDGTTHHQLPRPAGLRTHGSSRALRRTP